MSLLDLEPNVEPVTFLDGEVNVSVFVPDPPFGGVIVFGPSMDQQVAVAFSTGIQGPPGPPGPPGPQGPPGPTGAGGVTPPVTYPGSWRLKADGTIQFWNPDQSKWHSLHVGGIAGGEYLTIGAGET